MCLGIPEASMPVEMARGAVETVTCGMRVVFLPPRLAWIGVLVPESVARTSCRSGKFPRLPPVVEFIRNPSGRAGCARTIVPTSSATLLVGQVAQEQRRVSTLSHMTTPPARFFVIGMSRNRGRSEWRVLEKFARVERVQVTRIADIHAVGRGPSEEF